MKKYELTDTTKRINGETLYQIKALRSFRDVKEGSLGGFVASEHNLCQDEAAWVYSDAFVYQNARVFGNAQVKNNAKVYGNALIYDFAVITDQVHISGDASVFGNAHVSDHAKIQGKAHLYEEAQVFGYATAGDGAVIHGKAKIGNKAYIRDRATVNGKAHVYGLAIIESDALISGNADIQSNDEVVWISFIGPKDSTLTAYRTKSDEIYLTDTSLFDRKNEYEGSLQEFERNVIKRHQGSPYEQEYFDVLPFIKTRLRQMRS